MKQITAIFLLLMVFITACATTVQTQPEVNNEVKETEIVEESNWQDFELTDVRTGNTFKISDFNKPVLMESFAVWCPLCTKQQLITKKFHEEMGDSVISISIDMDPNEDKDKVLQHITDNEFDWYYTVSPVEFTQALINEFGVSVVNAPQVPMILICEDGSSRLLDRGVKSAETLKSEIAKGCSL